MKRKLLLKIWVGIAVLHLMPVTVSAFDYLAWPDGRRVRVVQTNSQVDLTSLKSGIVGHVKDRRFETNEAMFLANEIYLSGTEFFLRASESKLPIAHDEQFSFLTNVEAYWYSRYNLLSATARGRVGIGVIHGPYLDLMAQEATKLARFGRPRGELNVSNKDVMLTGVVASFLGLSGMPQKFDNAVPLMLEFKSGDPHFVRPVNVDIDFTGRATYQNDFEGLRWSHGKMEKTIDMGAVAQSLQKKVLWAKFFLRRNHMDEDFPGKVFLGNNAEDGFRGSVLTLEAVSTMLIVKSALFATTPEKKSPFSLKSRDLVLTGINPVEHRTGENPQFIPHEIRPTLIYMSDMPVRHYDFEVKNSSSQLWDQASWLWALTEFFDFANPRQRDNWDRVFGYQTPYDGSVMEQKYSLLAQSLANIQLDNIESMHLVDGVLASSWTPQEGVKPSLAISDLSLAMVALADFAIKMDLEPDRQERAKKILRQQADFLLKIANPDGSFHHQYRVPEGIIEGPRDMTSQAFAIRALLAAYNLTSDSRYADAARKTSQTWNREFWDEKAWLYRNEPGLANVIYTPVDVAAALGALREIILLDKNMVLLERFKRFFVQSVDASGLMQSEDVYTGESLDQVRAGNFDSDGDGIPFMSGGHGRFGTDTVFASEVEFNLDEPWSRPVRFEKSPTRPTSGQQIYLQNCAVCHGTRGEGNEGPKLIDNSFVQLTGREGVTQTVAAGRVGVGMPAWGGILSDEEIALVVDYIRSFSPGADREIASGNIFK